MLPMQEMTHFLKATFNCTNSLLIIKRKMLKFFISGPKGVINDWRKFKLESEDSDSIPPSKKEILRQMSSPQSRDDKDSKERVGRKVREAKKRDYKLCIS